MKKFFLIPLMTLLSCVMAWGATVNFPGDGTYATLLDAVNAAGDDGKVVLTDHITLSSGNGVPLQTYSTTIDLKGYTITSTTNYGIAIAAAGKTLTIEDSSADHTGKIEHTGASYALYGSKGVLRVKGGTITTTGSYSIYVTASTTLYFDDGTVSGPVGIQTLGTTTIANGTINGTTTDGIGIVSVGTLNITGGTIVGENIGVYNGNSMTVSGGSIEGGTNGIYLFNRTDKQGAIASTGSLNMTEGVVTGATGIFAISTGTVTISGGTISSSTSEAININNAGCTLNMNGGTATGPVGIHTFGTTTIANGTINGTTTYGIHSFGTLNITGGTIVGEDTGVRNTNNMTVSGGSIEGSTYGIYLLNRTDKQGAFVSAGSLNMTEGVVTGATGIFANSTGTVTISGGTISSSSSTAININNAGCTLNMNGGTATGQWALQNSGTATITNGTLDGGIWGIMAYGGSTTTVDGENVKIKGGLSGIQVGGILAGTTDVTVDFRAGAITSPSQCFLVYGPTDSSKQAVLNITGGTFTVTPTNPNSTSTTGIKVQGNSKSGDLDRDAYNAIVNISGGTFNGGYAGVSLWGKGAVANISGGNISANGFAVCGNGTQNDKENNNGTEINITGGTIGSSTTSVGIYHPQAGTLNISGGTINGETGVGIKSGTLSMSGGTIHAYGEGGGRVETWGNGIIESKAALQIESNAGYAGNMNITISDDATLISDSYYAIYEYGSANTAVNSIHVNGGHFQGGILTSQSLAAKGGFVSGGKWSKDITANVVENKAANPIDQDPYFFQVGNPTETTAQKVNGGQNAVLVNAAATSAEISAAQLEAEKQTAVTSTATNSVVVTENTDVVVAGEKDIVEVKKITVEGTDTKPVELTVTEGATLNVGTGAVLIGDYAKITVEEGAALVVDGLIYGATENNFVVETSEEKPAIVLFSPETEFIKEDHPMATVTLKSKGYKRGEGDFVWQRFGIPANMAGMTRGSVIYDHENAASAFYSFDYANNKWKVMANEDAFTPFQCYEVTCGAVAPGTVYTFQCPIMGNADYTLNLEGDWNYYANSYTAPINIYELLTDFTNTNASLNATVYVYRSEDNWWDAVNLMDYWFDGPAQAEIDPMQAFIFRRGTGSADPTINYENHIYNPIVNPSSSPAPARSRNDVSKAIVEITAADGSKDEIRLVESELFSAEYDNGYDGAKYMNNESFNLFAMINNEEMGKLATDNLEGTMLNMATKEQTSFTMTFSNVKGMSYAVRDMLTGTETMIAEGETYMFSVPANSNIEGRFQIVRVNKVLTDIENIEQAAAVKGIYTLSGQYVGNNYYNLPAGVYVVDGKKIVK